MSACRPLFSLPVLAVFFCSLLFVLTEVAVFDQNVGSFFIARFARSLISSDRWAFCGKKLLLESRVSYSISRVFFC